MDPGMEEEFRKLREALRRLDSAMMLLVFFLVPIYIVAIVALVMFR